MTPNFFFDSCILNVIFNFVFVESLTRTNGFSAFRCRLRYFVILLLILFSFFCFCRFCSFICTQFFRVQFAHFSFTVRIFGAASTKRKFFLFSHSLHDVFPFYDSFLFICVFVLLYTCECIWKWITCEFMPYEENERKNECFTIYFAFRALVDMYHSRFDFICGILQARREHCSPHETKFDNSFLSFFF